MERSVEDEVVICFLCFGIQKRGIRIVRLNDSYMKHQETSYAFIVVMHDAKGDNRSTYRYEDMGKSQKRSILFLDLQICTKYKGT